MSLLGLNRLIDDADHNSELWIRLMEWPQEVLQEYALSDDELDALRSGDQKLLKEFGVDEYHLGEVRELVVYQ